MTSRIRVGLVLTGGGSRAAYQVGVIRALAMLPVDVVAVSAVGAGALNGAIVASSSSLNEASINLQKLWMETLLSEESAVRIGPIPVLRLGTYLTLLFAGGVKPEIEEQLRTAAHATRDARNQLRTVKSADGDDLISLAISALEALTKVTTDTELDAYLSSMFAQAAAHPLLPFFVSVYQVDEDIVSKLRTGLELAGLLAVGAPRYIAIHDPKLTEVERLNAVLASTTLPFICEQGSLSDGRFIDGSFAGMKRSAGAVPLQPLRRDEAINPDLVIVVHTESGVTWDANDFRDRSIIEIRPSIVSDLADVGFFWSNKDALNQWMELGFSDTLAAMKRYQTVTGAWQRGAEIQDKLRKESEDL